MSETTAGKIKLTCTCGATIRVPMRAAGQQVFCPKCGHKLVVPLSETPPESPIELEAGEFDAPTSPLPPIPLAPVEEDASDPPAVLPEESLDESADTTGVDLVGEAMEQQGGGLSGAGRQGSGAVAVNPCPECGEMIVAGDVLCTACGHHLESGTRVERTRRRLPSPKAVAFRAARAAGSFASGVMVCVVLGTIGAAGWYLLALNTMAETGYVAWGVGLLCGVGMALGARSTGLLKGGVAAIVTLALIMLLKVVAFYTIETGRQLDVKRALVAIQQMRGGLREAGHDPDRVSANARRELLEGAIASAAQLPTADIDRQFNHLDAQLMLAEGRRLLPQDAIRTIERELADREDLPGFWEKMVGPLDILFILFALGTAYKVGESGLGLGVEAPIA